MPDVEPPASEAVETFRAEAAKFRELVGPDEKSYLEMKLEVLAARDHAIGTEAELGELRSRVQHLEEALTTADDVARERHEWILASEPLIAALRAERDRLGAERDRLISVEQQLRAVHASRTWRFGRTVLAPWHAVRRAVRER